MKFIFSFLFLILIDCSYAQLTKDASFTGCATDQLMQLNAPLLTNQQALDLQKYNLTSEKSNHLKGGSLKSLEIIPVVVHIIHNGGPENISDAQVVTAIADFNTRFAQSSTNQIQFCLAQRDPNGNATTGITRNVSLLTTETMEFDDIALKDLNRWTPTCYLNIWIVQEILSASMGSGVIGYAYLPAAHGLPMDGIVIEAGYFGSSYENDAVGVHEIGHYLGLYHTFEGGCNNSNCLLNGDQVCDTPPDQTTFASCNPPTNSCNTDADDPSANNPFSSDVADYGNDYMDYSNLSCYNQFTDGQYDRMHYFLTTTRQSLLGCMSCLPPCSNPITATITNPVSTQNIIVGTTITFSGVATNSVDYEWYISPGTNLSTTLSASNTFNSAGNYWVKFRAISNDPDFCLDGLDSVLIIVSQPVVSSCFGSLLFDTGNNISVDLPLSNQYYSGLNSGYTWECWFKLNDPFDADVRPLISSVDAVVFEDMWLGFGWQGGFFNEPVTRLVFKVDGPNSTVPSAPNCSYEPVGGFQIGTWYHAAGVMDYTTQNANLYVNGQLVDTKPILTPPITRVIPTELSFNWSNIPLSFRGNMDEVRIWDRPRTATEISANYNQCVDAQESNLVVYYQCNQAAGSTVIDASPNGNDGTFSINEGWSVEEPNYIGTLCVMSCIEICGNGIDDNNDGEIDEDCLCPAINAGTDTVICSGSSVQLNATSGFTSYVWTPTTGLSNPTIQNPIATPIVTTDYTVSGTISGPELVVNSDFSAGNTGFFSAQNYTSNYSPCNYFVAPGYFTLPDPTLVDHTPTNDNMYMSIDGCPAPTIVWEQSILGIEQNTSYDFKFWASKAEAVQPDFEIHLIGDVTGDLLAGTQAGIPYAGVWSWDEYGISNWNSGNNTSVVLRVINTEVNSFGNDFGMDDFSFRKVCTVSDVVRVTTINNIIPTLDLGNDIQLCASGTHVITANDGFLSYLWSDGSTEKTYTAYGIGTYWVTVTDSCGGIQTDTLTILLLPSPTLDLGADKTICFNETTTLSYTSTDVFTSFQWSPIVGLSCVQCPNPTATPAAPMVYYLTASTTQGCIAIDSIQILIEASTVIDLSILTTDATCDEGGIVKLNATSNNSDLILYNFNQLGFSTNNVYSDLVAGIYELTINTGEGTCPFDTLVEIQGEDYTLYIPNAFTPNGDTYNQLWSIDGVCIAEIDCRIYNRWGEEIVRLNENDQGWDGKYKGELVKDGIYTYTIRVVFSTEIVYFSTGFIAVLR